MFLTCSLNITYFLSSRIFHFTMMEHLQPRSIDIHTKDPAKLKTSKRKISQTTGSKIGSNKRQDTTNDDQKVKQRQYVSQNQIDKSTKNEGQ